MDSVQDRLKRAAANLKAGYIVEAHRAFDEIVKEVPGNPAALHGLGVCLLLSGNAAGAVSLILRAAKADPQDPDIQTNLGNARRAGGDMDSAVVAYRRATELAPLRADMWSNLIGLYLAIGEARQAMAAAEKALVQLPEDSSLQTLAGVAAFQAGSRAAAKTYFEAALSLKPANAGALNGLGALALDQGKLSEAEEFFTKSLEADPKLVEAHVNLGEVYKLRHKPAEARAAFDKALALDPNHVSARFSKAFICEQTNAIEEAEALTAAILKDDPAHKPALILAARLARRRKEYGAARSYLERTAEMRLDVQFRILAAYEWGALNDAEGRSAKAFGYFTDANALKAETLEARRSDPGRFLDWIEGEMKRIPAVDPVLPEQPAASPIFLVGFPRSGTTLLGHILGSHPGIVLADEVPALQVSGEAMDGAGVPAAEARKAYREKMSGEAGRKPETILLDKLPLNMVRLRAIATLFPGARVIMALRHPGDVCMSNFMQNYELNDAMSSFLTLEGTAKLYDRVMNYWHAASPRWPLRIVQVRYEDIVRDMAAEMRRLLTELDLPWDDAVLEYRDTARARDRIRTPSYHQVVQPIYSESKDRWAKYRIQLKPVLPLLMPHAKAFGYEF